MRPVTLSPKLHCRTCKKLKDGKTLISVQMMMGVNQMSLLL